MDKDLILQKLLEKADIVFTVRHELGKETDRGCCLMAASFLEHELEQLLRQKLIGARKFVDTLFEFNGPLGTFSSKIKLSYSLGLISKETLNDLEIIRKVRNEFGHTHQPINFETPELKNKIHNLKSHFYDKGEKRTRAFFTNAVAAILAEIHSAEHLNAPFVEKKVSPFQNAEEKKKRKEFVVQFADLIVKELGKIGEDN
jgi:DNA-binding MltR family transcriptional regulator